MQDKINQILDGRVWRIDLGNGVPLAYRFRSTVQDPKIFTYEALEITNINGKEHVAILRRLRVNWEKWENKRTVFEP